MLEPVAKEKIREIKTIVEHLFWYDKLDNGKDTFYINRNKKVQNLV